MNAGRDSQIHLRIPPAYVPPTRLLLGPGPSPVHHKVLEAMARPTIGHLDPAFLRLMDEVRAMLKAVFRGKNDLTFPVSGTGMAGMETCLVNLLEPGDEALILQNGFFGGRMADIAARAGAKVYLLQVPFGQGFNLDHVEHALEGKQVKLVAFVHAETSTGYRQDVPEIAALAHRFGALVVVDAVTSLGCIPLEVDAWGIDAIYSGTQKGLGCPPGLSPVSFGPRAVDALEKRKTKVQSWYLDLSTVRKYWGAERAYHHTAPINALYGLHEALRLTLEEGLEARWKRHAEVSARFVEGIESMGLEMLVDPAHRLPQLNSFRIPAGFEDKPVRKALLDEFGIEIGAGLGELTGKIWRVGLMGEGARPEVADRALDALRIVLKKR
jgi:alanine-glyoxylate transaminase/serine-glyoxylate transaminase/serine-pyruvate transaminase